MMKKEYRVILNCPCDPDCESDETGFNLKKN